MRASLIPVLLLGSCASMVTVSDVVDDIAKADVVFLGEQHGNPVGNFQELEWLRMLHERREHIVLSMEFFERDVQSVLDSYIAGEIDEEQFLEESRPSKNYRFEHRPLIEYCKEFGVRVIAANAPIDLVRKVSREGAEVMGMDHAPRETSAPRDAYWNVFVQAMEGHAGVDDTTMYRFYRAQCLRDDAMAESIVDALGSGGDQPLVVHVVGQLHVQDSLGTFERVRARRPDTRCVVLTMATQPSLQKVGEDYYTMTVPPAPPKRKRMLRPGEDPAEIEDEPQGRPALGFMPNYESEGGVEVEYLVEGGPAEAAGLEDGDLIIRVDGEDIADTMGYVEVLSYLTIGKTVEVVVRRGDAEKTFEVVVGTRSH